MTSPCVVVVRFRCCLDGCHASGHDHEKTMAEYLRGLLLTMDVIGIHAEKPE